MLIVMQHEQIERVDVLTMMGQDNIIVGHTTLKINNAANTMCVNRNKVATLLIEAMIREKKHTMYTYIRSN